MDNSTTGLLAGLRQQDLLREAAQARLLPDDGGSGRHERTAGTWRRLVDRRVSRLLPRLVGWASPVARRRGRPERLRRAPGRA